MHSYAAPKYVGAKCDLRHTVIFPTKFERDFVSDL